jgi:hypothetical protein
VTRSFRLLAVVVLAVVLVACSFRPVLAQGGTIRVIEVTTNNDATTEFHFTIFSLPVEFTLTGGSQSDNFLPEGSHIIQQTVPPGWVLTDISCEFLDSAQGGEVFAVGSLGVASYGPQFGAPQYDLADHSVTLYLAVDSVAICTFTDAPGPVAPVGGIVEPVNQLAVLAPYLALFGVIGAVAVVFWKRPQN